MIVQPSDFLDRCEGLARSFIGVGETAPNRGPLIDRWSERIGIEPGNPWCLSYALGAVYIGVWRQLAGDEADIEDFPLPLSGRVRRFWDRVPPEWKSSTPVIGALYCHASDPFDVKSPGHCGIVSTVNGSGLTATEGNTNEAGEREGRWVLEKIRRFDYVNLGYVRPPGLLEFRSR